MEVIELVGKELLNRSVKGPGDAESGTHGRVFVPLLNIGVGSTSQPHLVGQF
jgi:hypothetical protein